MDFKLNKLKKGSDSNLEKDLKESLNVKFNVTILPDKINLKGNEYYIKWNHTEDHDIFKKLENRSNIKTNEELVEQLILLFTYIINNVKLNNKSKYCIINTDFNTSFIFYIDTKKKIINIRTIMGNSSISDDCIKIKFKLK